MSRLIAAMKKPAPRDGYMHLAPRDVLVLGFVCAVVMTIIFYF